jgi:hypothetical protein
MRQPNLVLLAIAMVLSVMVALCASAAAAPPSPLARYRPTSPGAIARFEAGNRLYKSARLASRAPADRVLDLRRAVDEYTAGQALEDAPAFDYNLGHAARLLDDPAKAVGHLQRFLDRAQPDEPLRGAVEREIVELDPSGAIRAELRTAKEPTTKEPLGESRPVPASPLSTAPLQVSPAASPVAPGADLPLAPLAVSATAKHRGSRTWGYVGWGLTATGVAGAGVATWLVFDAAERSDSAKDTGRPTSDRLALQRQADSRRRAAMIVGIGSGAAIALGVVTLLLPARAHPASTDTAWNLGITGNGVAVFGSF